MRLRIPRGAIMAVAMLITATSIAAYVEADSQTPVIKVVARKFEYTPNVIKLKVGVPVVLELTSEDVLMGFNVPGLRARADMMPGKATRLALTPAKVGTFPFQCDIFCGSGHEDMGGSIVVTK